MDLWELLGSIIGSVSGLLFIGLHYYTHTSFRRFRVEYESGNSRGSPPPGLPPTQPALHGSSGQETAAVEFGETEFFDPVQQKDPSVQCGEDVRFGVPEPIVVATQSFSSQTTVTDFGDGWAQASVSTAEAGVQADISPVVLDAEVQTITQVEARWARLFKILRRLSFLRRTRSQITDYVKSYDGVYPSRGSSG